MRSEHTAHIRSRQIVKFVCKSALALSPISHLDHSLRPRASLISLYFWPILANNNTIRCTTTTTQFGHIANTLTPQQDQVAAPTGRHFASAMTTEIVDGCKGNEDEGGGGGGAAASINDNDNTLSSDQYRQASVLLNRRNSEDERTVDIFVKHLDQQQQQHQEQQRERRSSLPADAIELTTLSGVVRRRKQQLQMRYQQQQSCNTNQNQQHPQQHLMPNVTKTARPLSISSISSAASSGSSSSANSSSSSGIQSSLTRNGSLNYGHEFRKNTYLASVESLNNPHTPNSLISGNNLEIHSIENAFKNLNLSSQFKDAATRAAVLAAGESQRRGFSTPGNRISRINRSLHASLRYDKNTAYRIHLMANARALTNNNSRQGKPISNDDHQRRGGSISRNNSSTSSDSGHPRQSPRDKSSDPGFVCQCGQMTPTIISSSSASRVDGAGDGEKDLSTPAIHLFSNKAATLDGALCQRSDTIQHHPDCSYVMRPRKASAKLQPSPSSASSHSNTSLFRDDGFEDDLTSMASEHTSSIYHRHHRLSFQGQNRHLNPHPKLLRQHGEEDDEYQSCEEDFSNSHTTASTTSNLDDCALSTTSSSIIHQEQQVLDKVSLANVKQQYRKSLLLEHQQQALHSQHTSNQNKIQALLQPPPKLCHLSTSTNQGANTSSTSSNISSTSPTKQSKCDDRTVNIIGHMPTRSPGYWDSNLSITQRVVTEIIETERTYVDDLEQIVTGYICYLRNVLKQQKHQQQSHQRSNVVSHQKQLISSNIMVKATDDDDKSMLVYDDEITSATNEVDDYDVEEADNDIAMKENVPNMKSQDVKQSNCATNETIISAIDIKKLFSNLEDIYKFNKDLLFRLEECYLNPSSVAECFVENASGFEVYTHYCTMYPQVVSTLTELMANPTSAQLLKERQNELNQSLPLGAYLLKPVQRILKYHILFQSLIKHTADDEAVNEKDHQLINEAFSVMTSIACHINAMKKRHEHSIRVQEVQGLLCGWEVSTKPFIL